MVHLVCDYSDSPLHISICNRDFHLSAGVPSSLLPYKQRFYSGWQRDQLKDYISYPPHAGRWDHMTKCWPLMWKWKRILSIPGRLSQGSWFSRSILFSALSLFLFLLPPGKLRWLELQESSWITWYPWGWKFCTTEHKDRRKLGAWWISGASIPTLHSNFTCSKVNPCVFKPLLLLGFLLHAVTPNPDTYLIGNSLFFIKRLMSADI